MEREEFFFDVSPGELYFACFEFALAAMVISYGEFSPANTLERIVALGAFVVAGSTYGEYEFASQDAYECLLT